MRNFREAFSFCLFFVLIAGIGYCTKGGVKGDIYNGNRGDSDLKYNFKFIGYDQNIKNPDNDRRSYYRIFIDKIESGRTTIGLESQFKTFTLKLPQNRHLLTVEKWVLNKKKKRYVKLNNIDQPKPDFFYFTVPEKRKVVVILNNNIVTGNTLYSIDLE